MDSDKFKLLDFTTSIENAHKFLNINNAQYTS